ITFPYFPYFFENSDHCDARIFSDLRPASVAPSESRTRGADANAASRAGNETGSPPKMLQTQTGQQHKLSFLPDCLILSRFVSFFPAGGLFFRKNRAFWTQAIS